jgi:hypothetical protein
MLRISVFEGERQSVAGVPETETELRLCEEVLGLRRHGRHWAVSAPRNEVALAAIVMDKCPYVSWVAIQI